MDVHTCRGCAACGIVPPRGSHPHHELSPAWPSTGPPRTRMGSPRRSRPQAVLGGFWGPAGPRAVPPPALLCCVTAGHCVWAGEGGWCAGQEGAGQWLEVDVQRLTTSPGSSRRGCTPSGCRAVGGGRGGGPAGLRMAPSACRKRCWAEPRGDPHPMWLSHVDSAAWGPRCHMAERAGEPLWGHGDPRAMQPSRVGDAPWGPSCQMAEPCW